MRNTRLRLRPLSVACSRFHGYINYTSEKIGSNSDTTGEALTLGKVDTTLTFNFGPKNQKRGERETSTLLGCTGLKTCGNTGWS
jgi:hypothetical protein